MTDEEKKAEETRLAEEKRLADEVLAKKVAEAKGPLTQEDFDRIYKEMRENQEKLERSEKEKVDLVGRVAALESGPVKPKVEEPAAEPGSLKEKFTLHNPPKTEEEWDDLIAEHPTYGTDLRGKFLQGQSSIVIKARESQKKVMAKHPDMFKRNTDGTFKLDAKGECVLDMDSDKAKLFAEVYDRDPAVQNLATAPELIMAEVELRLSGKGEAEVKEKLEKEKREAEEKRLLGTKGGGVASGGGAPPEKKISIEVKFNSTEEKQHAESLVASGAVKTLEDYCRVRDTREVGYGRGGF